MDRTSTVRDSSSSTIRRARRLRMAPSLPNRPRRTPAGGSPVGEPSELCVDGVSMRPCPSPATNSTSRSGRSRCWPSPRTTRYRRTTGLPGVGLTGLGTGLHLDPTGVCRLAHDDPGHLDTAARFALDASPRRASIGRPVLPRPLLRTPAPSGTAAPQTCAARETARSNRVNTGTRPGNTSPATPDSPGAWASPTAGSEGANGVRAPAAAT